MSHLMLYPTDVSSGDCCPTPARPVHVGCLALLTHLREFQAHVMTLTSCGVLQSWAQWTPPKWMHGLGGETMARIIVSQPSLPLSTMVKR